MNRLPPLIGVALCVVGWGTLPAAAQTRAGTLGSGGALAHQGETRLNFTLGQAVAGGVAGSGVVASQGFWHPSATESISSDIDNRTNGVASLTLVALPNPFSGSAELQFSVPSAGRVSLELCDALGRHVRTLIEDDYEAGTAVMPVDLSELASGDYTAVLCVGDRRVAATLVLID